MSIFTNGNFTKIGINYFTCAYTWYIKFTKFYKNIYFYEIFFKKL